MIRFRLLASALAAIVLAAPTPALANPGGDFLQAWRNFGGLKSYHAEMKMPDRSISLDQVVPDKMHVTTSDGMQMIRIHSDMWIYRGGSWMKIPVAMPQMGALGESARTMGMRGRPDSDNYTVTYLGPAAVNGAPAQHYRIAAKDNSSRPVEIWIGSNHLPLEVLTQMNTGPMTILYSKYDAVPDITPPM